MAAVVSGDPEKRAALSKEYGVPAYDYPEYDGLVASGKVDAVYNVLTNTSTASTPSGRARQGVHVLCEKPMAHTSRTPGDARRVPGVGRQADGRLPAALRGGQPEHRRAGEVRRDRRAALFESSFSQQVVAGNTRLDADVGGSPLGDIGVYCITRPGTCSGTTRSRCSRSAAAAVTRGSARSARGRGGHEVPRRPTGVIRDQLRRGGHVRVPGRRHEGDVRMEPAYSWHGS